MKRLRALLLVVAGSVLFAGLGYGAALTRASSDDGNAKAPDAPVTAAVQLRRISSSVIARGDAGFADPVQVQVVPGAPVPVVTATPVHAGDQVGAGDVLVEVAGRPVFLLPGRLPAYRDLQVGDVGPDVEQLERALAGLGYDPGTVDDEFTAATGTAIAALYRAHDYPVPTSTPAAGATRKAPAPTVSLPRSEVAFAPTLPRRVDRQPGRVGQLLPSKPIQLSGTTPVVTIGLTTADVDVLKRGMRAVVTLPDGHPVTSALAEVRRTTTGGTALVRLTHLSSRDAASLVGANVKVTIPLQVSAGPVLVVPLAALNTDAGGTVRVIKVDAHGRTEAVVVTVGLAADGFAEVTPTGSLAEGDRVVVGTAGQ